MTTLIAWVLLVYYLLEDKQTSYLGSRMEKAGVTCCNLINSFTVVKPEGFRNIIIRSNRNRFTVMAKHWNI